MISPEPHFLSRLHAQADVVNYQLCENYLNEKVNLILNLINQQSNFTEISRFNELKLKTD